MTAFFTIPSFGSEAATPDESCIDHPLTSETPQRLKSKDAQPPHQKTAASTADRQVRTGLLFLFSFGMTGAYVGARSDADAVFLSRIGIERLPAMILVSASGVAIVTVSLRSYSGSTFFAASHLHHAPSAGNGDAGSRFHA